MSAEKLDRIFNPKSVAVIGGGRDRNDFSEVVVRNLVAGGYGGPILAVAPGVRRIANIETCPSVADLPLGVDLAIITTPLATVPDLVAECVASGMAGAQIVSPEEHAPGNGQFGIQSAIRKAAGREFRIIGPNSAGLINTRIGLNAGYIDPIPMTGRIALLSQSRAILTSILDLALHERIGFSHCVGIGSMFDVDFADLIDFFGSDNQVSAILIYVERFQRIRPLMSAARSVSRVKPIIALKAGRNRAMARTVAWHTGAPGSEDAVYDAAFKRAGILRVKTFEELFDCAELLAKQPRAVGQRIAIVTNTCGPAIMAADALCDQGLAPVGLASETMEHLNTALPPNWNRGNPIVIPEGMSAQSYARVVEICLEAKEVDALLLIYAPVDRTDSAELAQALAAHLDGCKTPTFTVWMGGTRAEAGRNRLNQAGITTFDTPERAVRAFMDLVHYGRNIEMLQAIPSRTTRQLTYDRPAAEALVSKGLAEGGKLRAEEAKALLEAYGIPILKSCPVKDANATKGERHSVTCDLFLGSRRDTDFGPILIFGPGGPLADIIDGKAIAFPPLNRLLARRMMEETRIYRLIAGRDAPEADVGMLEEVLIRLGQLVSDFPQIAELEINPLHVTPGAAWAADARVGLMPSDVPAPLHLAISPYPWQYEMHKTCKGDIDIFIRPIRPEDAPLLIELFNALSQHSIYLRFFSPIKQLSASMLVRLTQIDYDREIALVALDKAAQGERIIGVGRIITTRHPGHAEFSIIVGDPWQGLGIGAALLQHCLTIARDHGIQKVWGVVLAENTHMLTLGRKLGFTVQRAGGAEYELTIDLSAERTA